VFGDALFLEIEGMSGEVGVDGWSRLRKTFGLRISVVVGGWQRRVRK
jgi:hypothetical protein